MARGQRPGDLGQPAHLGVQGVAAENGGPDPPPPDPGTGTRRGPGTRTNPDQGGVDAGGLGEGAQPLPGDAPGEPLLEGQFGGALVLVRPERELTVTDLDAAPVQPVVEPAEREQVGGAVAGLVEHDLRHRAGDGAPQRVQAVVVAVPAAPRRGGRDARPPGRRAAADGEQRRPEAGTDGTHLEDRGRVQPEPDGRQEDDPTGAEAEGDGRTGGGQT